MDRWIGKFDQRSSVKLCDDPARVSNRGDSRVIRFAIIRYRDQSCHTWTRAFVRVTIRQHVCTRCTFRARISTVQFRHLALVIFLFQNVKTHNKNLENSYCSESLFVAFNRFHLHDLYTYYWTVAKNFSKLMLWEAFKIIVFNLDA